MAKMIHFLALCFFLGTLTDVKADDLQKDQTVQVFDDEFAKELDELSLDMPTEVQEPSWPAVQAVKDVFTEVSIKVLLGIVAIKEYFTGE